MSRALGVAAAAAVAWLALAPGWRLSAQDGPVDDGAPGGRETRDATDLPETSWFPDSRRFASPIADPLEPRFGVGLIATDLFESTGSTAKPPFLESAPAGAERDVQGLVSLGGTLPLWRAAPWEGGGLVVGAQAGVFARFRMEHPSRHAVATDWVVAVPIEASKGALSGRLRIVHRSAHLGDELIESNGARRIEFGHEAIELLGAYRIGGLTRIYGGGGWVFRSNTDKTAPMVERGGGDRGTLQAGAEVVAYPWSEGLVGYVAAVDWQAADRTGWSSSLAAVGGLSARSDERSVQLLLRYFDGAAAVGEFFLSDETYWGIELVVSL